MMCIPHILAGAAVAKLLRRPVLAYPAAIASHLVLDVVPHLDAHGMFGVASGGPTRAEAATAAADFLVGMGLLVLLAWRSPQRRLLLVGGLLGIVIDLLDNVPPWGPHFQTWPGTAWFSSFHHGIQHNVPREMWPLGFATQAVVVGWAVWVIRHGRRSRAPEDPHARGPQLP